MSDFYNDHSFCLKVFDKESYQQTISGLIEKANTLKKSALPKPKFAFSSKSKAASMPTAVDTTKQEAHIVTVAVDNPLDFIIKGINGVIKIVSEADIAGKENLIMEEIVSCTVIIIAPFKTAYIKNISESTLLISGVNGGCHVNNCHKCLCAIGTHQLRIHDSTICDMLVCVRSNPIIEQCSNMSFGRMDMLKYKERDAILSGVSLSLTDNKYDSVLDFKWLKKMHSPNWDTMSSDKESACANKLLAAMANK